LSRLRVRQTVALRLQKTLHRTRKLQLENMGMGEVREAAMSIGDHFLLGIFSAISFTALSRSSASVSFSFIRFALKLVYSFSAFHMANSCETRPASLRMSRSLS